MPLRASWRGWSPSRALLVMTSSSCICSRVHYTAWQLESLPSQVRAVPLSQQVQQKRHVRRRPGQAGLHRALESLASQARTACHNQASPCRRVLTECWFVAQPGLQGPQRLWCTQTLHVTCVIRQGCVLPMARSRRQALVQMKPRTLLPSFGATLGSCCACDIRPRSRGGAAGYGQPHAWSKAESGGALAAAQVRSTERTGRNLILDLRELPSKQALALRSEVAMQACHFAPSVCKKSSVCSSNLTCSTVSSLCCPLYSFYQVYI